MRRYRPPAGGTYRLAVYLEPGQWQDFQELSDILKSDGWRSGDIGRAVVTAGTAAMRSHHRSLVEILGEVADRDYESLEKWFADCRETGEWTEPPRLSNPALTVWGQQCCPDPHDTWGTIMGLCFGLAGALSAHGLPPDGLTGPLADQKYAASRQARQECHVLDALLRAGIHVPELRAALGVAERLRDWASRKGWEY